MADSFVHLHNHTQFSLLDGALRIGPLMEKAAEFNMPAVAITDHGNMFGAIEFYRMAKKFDIKPIIGCEVYVAPKDRKLKKGHDGISGTARHLTLIAKDMTGYKNLVKLVTIGYLEGFYYKPRIDKEVLSIHSEGIIALSGCLKGEIAHLLSIEKEEEAKRAAIEYRDMLGKDCFFIEIHNQFIEGQDAVNKKLIRLSKSLSIPLVAANDCHYLEKKDHSAHDALLCIQTGKRISDTDRMRFSTQEFYFKSPQEMAALFPELPEAIKNTTAIADMCDLNFTFNTFHMPKYDVPSGLSLDGFLDQKAREGLMNRLKDKTDYNREEYQVRLETELKIIKDMGYSGYFLIVWDFIDYARRHDIPVGPGRGSAAGSLVAYALGITNLDPLKYSLIFERFLNPERISMPDIDVDFCMEKRDKVIDYVVDKYGKENVTQIITFGTMLAKGVIRDVGRVMDMPYGEVDKIAKLIPNRLKITIESAIKEERSFNELIKGDEKVSSLIDTAIRLEGLTRHASTHAAGIVISPKPLVEYIPLYKNTNTDDIVTQYPMGDIERLGLLKMDFLGLKTLTVIDNALKMIKGNRGCSPDIDKIPLDDKDTYKLLSEARTLGVFQLESSGMRDLLRKFNPNRFEDIIAIIALYRPGPLNSGMVDDYIKRKHGHMDVTYELPQLEDILRETYGVIVYQEQVMKIARVLADYSLGEADLLRRAMGKKKADELPKLKEKFVSGALKKGINKKIAEKIFDLMAHFAEYGFNKSHSAAYALISYQTAYLKAHYPEEFMASLLSSEMGNTDKVIEYINECRSMGVSILPPDINESCTDFSVSKKGIRFGMAGVKNVGKAAVENIIRVRRKRKRFSSIVDFCEYVDLRVINKKVIESLIKCGAFDSTGMKRSVMMQDIDRTIEYAQKVQKDRSTGQTSLFGDNIFGEKGLSPFSHSDIAEFKEKQRLAYEKEMLGFYVSGHPLMPFESYLKRFASTNSQDIRKNTEQTASIGGVVSQIKQKLTRKGDKMAFVTLEDLYGSVEVVVFPELLKDCMPCLNADEPVFVKGTIELKDSDAKLIAKEIMPLSMAKERFSHIHINLRTAGLEKDLLVKLRDIFVSHRGKNTVLLHFLMPNNSKVSIMADKEFSVSPTDTMLSKVEGLVGDNSVYFE